MIFSAPDKQEKVQFFHFKPGLVSEKLAAVKFAFLSFLTMFSLQTLCVRTLFTDRNFKGRD